jgi:zinc and cadmium transporter
MTPRAPVWLLAGFFGLHLFNRFLTSFVCEKDPDKKDYVIGIVPMIGIGFHSLIDGFIYSIAFTVSILTGFLATMGMVLHEFPEGIITYLLLVRGRFTEHKGCKR